MDWVARVKLDTDSICYNGQIDIFRNSPCLEPHIVENLDNADAKSRDLTPPVAFQKKSSLGVEK